MTFGSVCSGIEAASVAWHPLGWKTAWVSDIDPFASALLKHHYPGTHNYGDFTGITADAPAIDVLVGGTPCQSFSVAGLRGGLDDDRGNLALEFCRHHSNPKDGTGRGTPLVPILCFDWQKGSDVNNPRPSTMNAVEDVSLTIGSTRTPAIAFSCKDHGADAGELSPTLRAMEFDGSHANGGGQVAVAFTQNGSGDILQTEMSPSMGTNQNATGRNTPKAMIGSAVRRLTPLECERLQGFPDGYTAVLYRGKPAADGPRYKALGNSMAVPVMRWIGERIQMVENL